MIKSKKNKHTQTFFFFSSRRRHTRWNCDWSSDVCSSDLNDGAATQGSPVTFCDGRTFFASASGQTQLTADILAAVQVVRPRLAAGAPLGPRLRADSDSQP